MFGKGTALLLWTLQPAQEDEDEWNEWYNLEHVWGLLQVPGFLSANRYRVESTRSLSSRSQALMLDYLSLYELSSINVLESEEYAARRLSLSPGMRPHWTQRMLRAVDRAAGGVYEPRSSAWLAKTQFAERRVDHLAVVSFGAEPSVTSDEAVGEAVDSALSSNSAVYGFRSFTLLRGSPPIRGIDNRLETANQIKLCAIKPGVEIETIANGIDIPDHLAGTVALYSHLDAVA